MKTKLQLLLLALFAVATSAWAVQVNLTFHADGNELGTVKVEAGNSYTISTLLSTGGIATPSGCRGYEFVGWKEDGPVEGDETPTYLTASSSITPAANINLYAVYRKSGSSDDRYVRITSTTELHAGSQYIIACYYEWDGDTYYGPSYYALGNTQSTGSREKTNYTYTPHNTTYDVYATCYHLSATQVEPQSGVIINPGNTLIWTLSGEEDAWIWSNASIVGNKKKLCIRRGWNTAYYYRNNSWNTINTFSEELLVNGDSTCSVIASNGTFNFVRGNYYLTYSEDEDDYFKTGTSNDWTFYLYKKESEYTSFPNCSNWTVHLDALDGTISGTSPASATTDVTETSSGSGVTLPSASIAGAACSSWAFAGWYPESPIYGTTTAPTLHTASYTPSYDGETLYAVFQAGENVTYYEKISNADELTNGDVCVIVYTGNSYAVTYNNTDNSWTGTSMTIAGTRINNAQNANVEWTYNSSENCFYYGSTPLAYVGTRNTYNHLLTNASTPFLLRCTRQNQYYYVRWSGSSFANSTTNNQNTFEIYKKVTTYATYSSFPHCTPYSVTLNVAGGKFEDTGSRDNRIVTEVTAGGGVTLPNVLPLCPDDGWEFVGWQEGSEVGSVEDVTYTGLYTTSYAPSRDGVTLYAVFRRNINIFRILYQPTEMVAGDNYLITAYDGTYDYEISSATYSNNYLSGVQAAAPQGGEGYYIEVDTTAAGWKNVLWTMAGTYDNCTFLNVGNSKYLYSTTSGYTQTGDAATAYIIDRPTSSFYFTVKHKNNNYYINYNTTNRYFSTETSPNVQMYVYRQMKEYTSWPHCDPFTVNFDACGGTAGATSLTEETAYAGITLPNAYANSDCAKEGWSFVGWAASPVSEESSILPLDVMPAGTTYNPAVNNGTLYAVYQQKANTYKRITALSDLRLGLNYIIATSTNYAMSNTAQSTNYVASKSVTPASNVITSDDADIEWRVQGVRGAFEFYNADRDVYLDLSTAGYALLTSGSANDQFVLIVSSGVFFVRSIQALSNTKYLGFTSTYFNTVDDENLVAIYFYQQQATYHSYPNCAESVEALRWDKDGDNNYVYVESYVLSGIPNLTGALGDPELQSDGTFRFLYNTSAAPAGSKKPITWNGTTSRLTIPYVVSTSSNIGALGLPAKSEACDVVVLDGATLTVNANKEIHNLTIYEGATLNVQNGYTLTVNSLILRCEDDQTLPIVNLNASGAISLNNNEVIFDARIDEERYYWFSLPFNAQLQEISYSNLESNGGAPTYHGSAGERPFWVKYYNGALRAADVNGGSLARYWTHVANKGGDYTLQAGQGYIVGIGNQKTTTQADGRKHTKRVLRFTLKPGDNWLTKEQTGGSKIANVVPSSAEDSRDAVHAGWNLIGNPYMHSYEPSAASGIVTGEWEEGDDGYYEIKSGATSTVPYLTIYNNGTDSYSQVLAANYEFHPFEAVFVQINSGSQINFANTMSAAGAPARLRAAANPDVPFYTGVELRGNNDAIDRTGVVLCKDYTPAYEIGADLVKMENAGQLNLYTINADAQHLAFNGLSDEDAIAPIPVGVTFPATGEYTFAFDFDTYNVFGLEALELIDKEQNTTTDLLLNDYTFVANTTGAVNDRFQIVVRRAKEVPTDIQNVNQGESSSIRKFIRDGKLFIIRDNQVFDATGTRVQ